MFSLYPKLLAMRCIDSGLNPPNTLADCTGGAGGIIAPPWFIKVGVNPLTGATVGTGGVAKVGVYGV